MLTFVLSTNECYTKGRDIMWWLVATSKFRTAHSWIIIVDLECLESPPWTTLCHHESPMRLWATLGPMGHQVVVFCWWGWWHKAFEWNTSTHLTTSFACRRQYRVRMLLKQTSGQSNLAKAALNPHCNNLIRIFVTATRTTLRDHRRNRPNYTHCAFDAAYIRVGQKPAPYIEPIIVF